MKTCLVCEGISATEDDHCSSCGLRLVPAAEVRFPLRRGEADAGHPLLGALVHGKYRVQSVLGKGGMGTVFRATHAVSMVPVALKVLHPRFAIQPEHRRFFLAEAAKAGRVIHEHSARILDVGEESDGTLFIAMELVEGETLAEWMHSTEPLPTAVVLEILEQVCSALAVAHGAGVVHLDLTPRNVLCTVRDGRPFAKILDFGIARAVAAQADGESAGPIGFATPPYAAPEHLDGSAIDGRADLYSLGVIAFEALTQRLPVAGSSAEEFLGATLAGDVERLRPARDQPKRLVRLVNGLLSFDPEDRPADAGVVRERLKGFLQPARSVLGGVAMVAVVLALLALVVSLSARREYRLRALPGSIYLSSTDPTRGERPQEVRSEQLRTVEFEIFGFAPSALRCELSLGRLQHAFDCAPEPLPLVDPVQRKFRITTASEPFRNAVDELAKYTGAGTLRFVGPGGVLLAANLLVDDDPPFITWGASTGLPNEVRGDSIIDLDVKDKGSILRAELLRRNEKGELEHWVDWPRTPSGALRSRVTASELLGAVVAGCGELRELDLVLEVQDQAGNIGTAAWRVDRLDLAAPKLEAVRGRFGLRADLVTVEDGVADLRVTHVGDGEGDFSLLVFKDGEEVARLPVRGDGARWRVASTDPKGVASGPPDDAGAARPPGTAETGFEDGDYRFQLLDAIGNRSEFVSLRIRFTAVDLRVTLRQASKSLGRCIAQSGQGTSGGDRLVGDGRPATLEFRCNPLFKLAKVVVTAPRFEQRLPLTGPKVVTGPDDSNLYQKWFDLPALAQGRYRLVCSLEGADQQLSERSYELFVLAEPLTLRLNIAPGSVRFSSDLVAAKLVRETPDGNLALGSGWLLRPAWPQFVNGWISVASLASIRAGFGDRQQVGSSTLPGALGVGRSFESDRLTDGAIAVSLTDVFGRAVQVLARQTELPAETLRTGEAVVIAARFQHESGWARRGKPVVQVEFEQPTKIQWPVPLPFLPTTDTVDLIVAGRPVRGTVRAISVSMNRGLGMRSELEFLLPFELVQFAAKLTDVGRARFAENVTRILPVELRTPAGSEAVDLEVRTVRTTLRVVDWPLTAGDTAGGSLEGLPRLTMVPNVGLVDGVHRDPVPADVLRRAAFRPQPRLDVRNIATGYLQQSELTRREYHALWTTWEKLPEPQRQLAAVVHRMDPMGADRLRSQPGRPPGWYPVAFAHREDDWAFERQLQLGGDRPVSGLNYWQAYATARVAGVVTGKDPDLFRLPSGVELERAAMGSPERPRSAIGIEGPAPLNGPAASGRTMRLTPFAYARTNRNSPALWPLTEKELRHAGAFTRSKEQGERPAEFVGLDFGVREWTLDLPPSERLRDAGIVKVWLGDHRIHLERARELALDRLEVAESLINRLATVGIVRGRACGESRTTGRILGYSHELPASVEIGAGGDVPATLPGVTHTLVLRRDGRGLLLDEIDPHLPYVGMRLAAGAEFERRVR